MLWRKKYLVSLIVIEHQECAVLGTSHTWMNKTLSVFKGLSQFMTWVFQSEGLETSHYGICTLHVHHNSRWSYRLDISLLATGSLLSCKFIFFGKSQPRNIYTDNALHLYSTSYFSVCFHLSLEQNSVYLRLLLLHSMDKKLRHRGQLRLEF